MLGWPTSNAKLHGVKAPGCVSSANHSTQVSSSPAADCTASWNDDNGFFQQSQAHGFAQESYLSSIVGFFFNCFLFLIVFGHLSFFGLFLRFFCFFFWPLFLLSLPSPSSSTTTTSYHHVLRQRSVNGDLQMTCNITLPTVSEEIRRCFFHVVSSKTNPLYVPCRYRAFCAYSRLVCKEQELLMKERAAMPLCISTCEQSNWEVFQGITNKE